MISFIYIELFLLVLLLVFLYFIPILKQSYEELFSKDMLKKIIVGQNIKKRNLIFLNLSFIFLILALSRPVIKNKPIIVPKSNVNIVVAFDISASMKCDDVYPNRLNFSKNKFNHLLSNLKDEQVGIIGFSSRSFLVAPITNDYGTLKYLVNNLNQNSINLHGSNILSALKTTNKLLKESPQKAMIVFTDGTDTNDFQESIDYALTNNIKVFVYAVATSKGGVIKLDNGDVQKDSNGNIVITSLNSNIKELALQSGGAYLEFSSSLKDMNSFVKIIKKIFNSKSNESIEINTNQELFYIPLGLSLIFFLVSIFNFRLGRS